ncbi:MAG: hypothetical protein ACFFDN_46690, partial [Candidatus Hodarchaeota archaeon]
MMRYISGQEKSKEISLESARLNFIKAKVISREKQNLINPIKLAIFESISLNLFLSEKIIRIDEFTDFLNLALGHEDLITEIWDQINKHPDIPEIYLYYYLVSIVEFCHFIFSYLPAESSIKKQIILNNTNRIKVFIDKYENSSKKLCLFGVYSIYSVLHMVYPLLFVDNQFDLKKYSKISQKWIRKAVGLFSEKMPNPFLTVFYFTRFANAAFLTYLGIFTKDLKNVMDDLNKCIESISLYFPKIMVANVIILITATIGTGSVNPAIPESQRINFANQSLTLIESLTSRISLINNPEYRIFNLIRDGGFSAVHAMLGDLIDEEHEKSKHIAIATELFDKLLDIKLERVTNTYFYLLYSVLVSGVGILLARIASKESDKIKYYQIAIELLAHTKHEMLVGNLLYIEVLFIIGETNYELGKLINDDKILEKSYLAYMDAIEYCKNKGYFNSVATAYVNLALIEDRLGNYLSAAKNYEKAIESLDQAILTMTYTKFGKKLEKLKNYLISWKIIEIAKSYHREELHHKAQLNYEQASQLLRNIREYKYESPFYSAWAILEKAEYLSKQNKHQEAAATYLVSKNNFEDAINVLTPYLSKRTSEERERILKLTETAKLRQNYCTARYQIETARIESKKGNQLLAAELYNKAGNLFENITKSIKIKRERDELTAIFYLCRAWENMEIANLKQDPSLYAKASDLFKKAADHFPESRLKKLSLGNSLYCSALEFGGLFDRSSDLNEKIQIYKKIKMYLRESSKNYQLGGFKQDAQWVLATTSFFDGIWHLMQSDNETDFSKKNGLLNIATKYLNTSLKIFDEAEYKHKKEEISNYLEMIKDEKAILMSALNVIEKPEISASSIGISAPSYPVEVSSTISIEEMQRHDLTAESEISWRKRIHHIFIFKPNGLCIFDHSFKRAEEIEPQFVSGGITGISGLIQELTKSKSKIKIVEQEEMT